jgi:hypothetical protein
MAKQSTPKSKPAAGKGASSQMLWIGLGLVVVVALVALVIYQMQTRIPFSILGGEQPLVVLVRTDEQGLYSLRYTGGEPAQIKGVTVMLAGENLRVDVKSTTLRAGSQSVTLEKNQVPAGQAFRVEPQQTFEAQVNFYGQTIGYNYVYGFRITYESGGRERTVDVIDKDYKYLVTVE